MSIPKKQRNLIGIVATVIAFVLLFGGIALRSLNSRKARESTDRTVRALADRLDARVERSRYKRVASNDITEKDAWDQPLHIEYREEGIGERIIVRSAGPDRVFGTEDDVSANRFLLNAKGIGEEIHDGASSVANEVAKGAFQGVKEELKNSFKRKTNTNEVR